MENNKLLELNCVLRLYCSNFSNLHWNSIGEEFNDAHRSIAEAYVDLCHKYVDPTAEMLARLDVNPLNYLEVADYIKGLEKDYLVVESGKMYTRKDIISLADTMLKDICELLADVIADPMMSENKMNAGIKSELESILNEFDLQYRYINKRKLA